MAEVDLLPLASASTLVYRALSDEPDAIAIATEGFGAGSMAERHRSAERAFLNANCFAERPSSRPPQEAGAAQMRLLLSSNRRQSRTKRENSEVHLFGRAERSFSAKPVIGQFAEDTDGSR
jgi:hypothetical protein